MENASKALIIAGAILLSILIISLGIMIFSNARGVIDSNSMDQVAVETFNSKFTQYEGTNVRGANVNSLLQTIVQNNLTNSGDTSKQITVKISASNWSGTDKAEDAWTSLRSKALTGKSYNVSFSADSKSGYVTKVTIADA